jgi:hypothetical protein
MGQRGSIPGRWPQPPAGGRPLIGRRKAGERIGLLIVAVHDDTAGRELALRSGTARVQVMIDTLPHELDWSCAVALDCLVMGECAEPVFYAAVTMLHAAAAASIWGVFADGVWRLERYLSKATPQGFYAADGPVEPSGLAYAMKMHREHALMTRRGIYGTPHYAQARLAAFRNVFGDKAEVVQGMLDKRMAA